MTITKEELLEVTLISNDSIVTEIIDNLNKVLTKYEINTPQRIRHFLAQVLCESNGFHNVSENLNYSAKGLLDTFPTRFTTETAAQYAHQPQKIANHVYGGRYGNDTINDGWTYRGRGYIGITFKDVYADMGKRIGQDLINHPELLETIEYAMAAAGAFWDMKKLNAVADKAGDNVLSVTKLVNGGTNGLQTRQTYYNKLKLIIV